MRPTFIVLAVCCVVMIAGVAVTYGMQPDTGFDVKDNGDGTATMEVTGMMPTEISYMVLSDTDAPATIYMYLDDRYEGFVSYREQDRYLSALSDALSKRGFDNTEIIDADRLAQILDDPAASDRGVVIASGAIPVPAYPSDSDNKVLTFLSNGGTVYWSGPDIGLYRSVIDDEPVKIENGGYFGDSINDGEEECDVFEASDVSEKMRFACYTADYGLKANLPESRVLGLYDEYSSLSVAKVLSGRVYVLGCYLSTLEAEEMYSYADMIVSGITEDTVFKETGSFHKGFGRETRTVDISAGDTVYMASGKPATFRGGVFGF